MSYVNSTRLDMQMSHFLHLRRRRRIQSKLPFQELQVAGTGNLGRANWQVGESRHPVDFQAAGNRIVDGYRSIRSPFGASPTSILQSFPSIFKHFRVDLNNELCWRCYHLCPDIFFHAAKSLTDAFWAISTRQKKFLLLLLLLLLHAVQKATTGATAATIDQQKETKYTSQYKYSK